jgi:hypothetical protein
VQTISQLLNQQQGKPTPYIAESINNLHLKLRESGYCMNAKHVNAEQSFLEQWRVVETAINKRREGAASHNDNDIQRSIEDLFHLMKMHFPSISNKINKAYIKR